MNQRATDIVLCNAVRTPIGTFGGSLKDTTAPELGAAVIRAVVERSGLAPTDVDAVVMGQVVQAGSSMNPRAKLPSAAGCR